MRGGLENISQKNLLIGEPFRKNTTTTKWIVRAPNGKLYRFKNDVFSKTFQPGVYSLFSIPSAGRSGHRASKPSIFDIPAEYDRTPDTNPWGQRIRKHQCTDFYGASFLLPLLIGQFSLLWLCHGPHLFLFFSVSNN